MKKLAIAAAAFAAAVFCVPAQAADVPVRGPVYKAVPAPVFDWTGFYVGVHVGYGWGDANLAVEPSGIVGGVQAGYNWQLSRNWVFGVEGDFSATDMNDNVLGIPVHVDYLATIRGRVGYTWDTFMLYGTGGAAFTRVGALGVHASEAGYALGVGAEWAIARNWSAKLEYMFYDIEDFESSVFRVGLNYRFGR